MPAKSKEQETQALGASKGSMAMKAQNKGSLAIQIQDAVSDARLDSQFHSDDIELLVISAFYLAADLIDVAVELPAAETEATNQLARQLCRWAQTVGTSLTNESRVTSLLPAEMKHC
jgi:hypothetical protein